MSGFSLVLIVVVFDNYYLHPLFYYFAKGDISIPFPFISYSVYTKRISPFVIYLLP